MNPTIGIIIAAAVFLIVVLVLYVILQQRAKDAFREGHWKGSQIEMNSAGMTFYECLGISKVRHSFLNEQALEYFKKAFTTKATLGDIYTEINHLPQPLKEKLVVICEFQFKLSMFLSTFSDFRRTKEGMIEMISQVDTPEAKQTLRKAMMSELTGMLSSIMKGDLKDLSEDNVKVTVIDPTNVSKETLEEFGIAMPDSKKKTGNEETPVKSPDDQDEDSSLSRM